MRETIFELKLEFMKEGVFGHTHSFRDEVQKGIRLLNSGSVCNYLTKEAAYFVLKTEDRELKMSGIKD